MAVLDWLINTEVFRHRLGKCLWKCRLLFRLSSLWKGTRKSANWMEVIHLILGEKMRLDKVRAEVFCGLLGKSGAYLDHQVQVLSVSQGRCFPFAALRSRCQDGVLTPPLCFPLRTLAVSGSTSNTACQDALDNDLMQGVKCREGGFFNPRDPAVQSTPGGRCSQMGEGASQMCPTDN